MSKLISPRFFILLTEILYLPLLIITDFVLPSEFVNSDFNLFLAELKNIDKVK